MHGQLFLVVGPSGAGKDSLLDGAKAHFEKSAQFHFPRRYITRAKDAGGEDHCAVSDDEFDQLKSQGKLAFYWGAHDLKYGVPVEINEQLEKGIDVVVNVSRGVIDFVRESYDDVIVISVNVSLDVLEKRLRARKRECEDDIVNRLRRAENYSVNGGNVIEIYNNGALDEAVDGFIQALSKESA